MNDYFREITIISLEEHKVRTVVTEDPTHKNKVFVFYTDIKAITEGIDPDIAKLGDVNGMELREGAVVGICFRNSTKLLSVKDAMFMIDFSDLSKEKVKQYKKILEDEEKRLLEEYSVK